MRIFIDGTCLDTNQGTGIFRYVDNLLKGWSTEASENRYFIVSRDPADLSVKRDRRFKFVAVAPKISRKIFAWHNFDLPFYLRRGNFDVLFFPTYFIPFWGLTSPVVTVIYDVYYLAHPEWVPALKYQLMKRGTERAARHSKVIITGSEYDKRQIVKYLQVRPENVKVIYGVAEKKFVKKEADPGFRNKYKLGKDRVISCVGVLFNRRHQDVVVRAFDRLADEQDDVRLLLVGKNVTYPHINIGEIIAKCRNKDRILHVGYMPEEDMVDLYNSSEAFIYLSSHEGESFPLREALACEVPCLTTPILREVCADAAVYAEDPKNVECVKAGMQEVLNRRAELSAIAGSMKSSRTWNDIAMETLACVLQAADRSG